MVHGGKEALKGWIRTVFLPYTGRLPEALREDFVEQIADTYIERRPPDENGRIHVQMVRLEVQATV
jgi:trans-aconitate methyltransferase